MPVDARLAVLLVAPESAGGIGRHVRMLADGLVSRGVQVSVCAPGATLDRFDLAATGARLVPAPVGAVTGWWRTRARLAVEAADHDVTHAHGVRAAAAAALSGARPLVSTWHNAPLGSASRRGMHRMLEVLAARRSALVLGASADLVERARSAGAARVGLCEVAAPAMASAAPRDVADLHDPPRVLAVGRLHAQKRLDLLIDAAASWPAGSRRPEFVIAGDGPLAGRLRHQAQTQGAPVRLLGARTDVAELLAAADVVALPSDWEARPLVAQEALRAGVPLVATDVGGVRDLVGDAALLVPPRDPAALAEGIRRVLEDETLRVRLRNDGPARASTWQTVDEMVDQLMREYLEVKSRVSLDGGQGRGDTPRDGDDGHHPNT